MVLATSSAGLYANRGQAAYSAAKAAVIGLARALAIEGRRHDVLVNAIAPYAYSQLTAPYMTTGVASRFDPGLVAPLVAWLVSADCDVSGEILVSGAGLVRRTGVGESQAQVLAEPIGPLLRTLRGAALHSHASANDSFASFLGELDQHTRAGTV